MYLVNCGAGISVTTNLTVGAWVDSLISISILIVYISYVLTLGVLFDLVAVSDSMVVRIV